MLVKGQKIVSVNKFIDNLLFSLSKKRLKSHMREENDLEDVLNTISDYSGFGHYSKIEGPGSITQIRSEVRSLVSILKDYQPERIVEIGTSQGASLYVWCRCIESAKKIVSIDLPRGDFGGGYPKQKEKLFREFSEEKRLIFLRGNSHSIETRKKLTEILNGRKIDFLFIDGDHTYEGVKKDFEMYSPLVSDDGLIALHDIVPHSENSGCNVDTFWNETKNDYPTLEIIESKEQGWAGIGIIKFSALLKSFSN